MIKWACLAGLACILSLGWLVAIYAKSIRVQNWKPVTAEVVDIDSIDIPYTRQPMEWATTIRYTVDGVKYESVVDEYLLGDENTVYTNPIEPSEVRVSLKPTVQEMFYSIVASVFFGLLTVVLLLVSFSPKD